MMQDHRCPEMPCKLSHPLAAPMLPAASLRFGLGPQTEHILLGAPQDANAIRPTWSQAGLQICFLDQRPFLRRPGVGIAGPLDWLAPADIGKDHEVRMHRARLLTRFPLAAPDVQIDPQRQEFHPSPDPLESLAPQQLADEPLGGASPAPPRF